MKNINIFHVMFFLVLPVGGLIFLFSQDIISLFNSIFGVKINIGDVVIVYALISIVASKYAIRNEKEKNKKIR